MNTPSSLDLWTRYQSHYREFPSIGLGIDLSRVLFPDSFFADFEPRLQKAYSAMKALESGAIANTTEKRQVGHYWLRNPVLAPTDVQPLISSTIQRILHFAAQVHSGVIRGESGPFSRLLLVGIGGSALGPQFVTQALTQSGRDRLQAFFFDNTDPDGMERTLAQIGNHLGETLCIVISKSGRTVETRNGMLEAQAAWTRAGFDFAHHAVAVTSEGSQLAQFAQINKWLDSFPMWDWVGGRTSELSAVGLLPAALQGFDIHALLAGARACDALTREPNTDANPAAQLAAMWHYLGDGRGARAMVVLPYKDRLSEFSKYLQQLVMESLGKELDNDGARVNQGLVVYGNKGTTDEHSYLQQLRDGLPNFFALFIEVLHERSEPPIEVEPGLTSGDYLNSQLLGTRRALYENGRQSITLTVPDTSPFTIGALIALFERAVGFYATLIHINAYDQPGVEKAKDASRAVVQLKRAVVDHLRSHPANSFSAPDIAAALHRPNDVETVFQICRRLAHNKRHVQTTQNAGVLSTYRFLP